MTIEVKKTRTGHRFRASNPNSEETVLEVEYAFDVPLATAEREFLLLLRDQIEARKEVPIKKYDITEAEVLKIK